MNSTHEIPGGPDVAPFSNTRADCGDNFHLGRIIQRGYKFGGFDFKYGTIASRIVFVQERGVEICGLTRGERKCGVIRRQLGNQSISQRLRCLPWSGSALDTNGLPVEWDTFGGSLGGCRDSDRRASNGAEVNYQRGEHVSHVMEDERVTEKS